MYSAFLSYAQRENYVSWLVEKKLLERSRDIYLLSDKGSEFLSTYEKLTKQLDSLIPREKAKVRYVAPQQRKDVKL